METDIKNFAELSSKVQGYIRQQNWFSIHGMELAKIGARFVLFFLAWGLFALDPLIAKISGIFLMAYAYTGIAISGIHEASHRSLANHKWINKLWGYFFTDFWVAKSSLWWYQRHILTHHPHPNDPVKEPKLFYFDWINRYVYFLLIPYAAVPWFIISSIRFLWGRWSQLAIYLLSAVLGFLFHMSLFMVLGYSALAAFGLVLLVRSLLAPIFMHLAVFNHIGLSNPPEAFRWIKQQTLTTRNIRPNWFLEGLGGNAFLHGHLEHHLFPGISNHMIHKVRPFVVEHLKKYGYEYKEEGYFACLKQCLQNYPHLFKDLPEALW